MRPVWVNGHEVGTHPYGYTSFSFDITDYVKYDGENTIAVKVVNNTPSAAGTQEAVSTEM